MAAVTTANKEETARAGSDTPTGGMATVAAAAAADMVADMADTAAVTLPATAAALGAGVAVAAVAIATKRQCPMCPPDWMQDCALYTSISYSIFFTPRILPIGLRFFFLVSDMKIICFVHSF
jgi:hypothetical protein